MLRLIQNGSLVSMETVALKIRSSEKCPLPFISIKFCKLAVSNTKGRGTFTFCLMSVECKAIDIQFTDDKLKLIKDDLTKLGGFKT